jgi:pimeloyl-ACP methyl ester carboxylesterase/DNA-binding SARP family transcriptional activator
MTFEPPPIQFAQARGARLAWQMWGDGPATMVAIPPLAQNIEAAWEWPPIRHMLERFGSFSRYLHFDKRGTGASDRRSRVPGIDERIDDVRAVMDDAGIGTAHLFVQSDGGPTAMLFAATYPNRVDSLILFGTGAAMKPASWTEEDRIAARERRVTTWGTPESHMVDDFAPSLASDQEYRSWHQRYERVAASTDSLRELIDIISEMDVREVLPTLDVPTLVIHRVGDRRIPIALGRELAATIPGARLLELEGDDHFAYVGDLDEWMPEVERFVTGEVRHRPPVGISQEVSVRILTLGGFAVEVDGVAQPIGAWGSRLARQLCKRLVAARGWPLTRDELIDMLWPDESDMGRLSARLSVQLSGVRRVLGRGVVADRQTVRLDLGEVSTDLEDFYKATDDAAVVAAYAGEFLPEDRYEDWTMGPRDEARTRFVAAARRLANREREAGAAVRAATLARRIVEVDRYDDDAHRLVVESLLAAGEPGEARGTHAAWAAALAEIDVSVEPFDRIASS